MPEVPIDLPHLLAVLSRRRAAGKKYGIVIVAEGARFPDRGPFTLDDAPDPFGNPRLGGIGVVIADAIEKQTGLETRCVVLGHLQRGGPPSAYDRILATRLGLAASRLVLQRRFGTLVTLINGRDRRDASSARPSPPQDTRSLLLRRGRGVLLTEAARISREVDFSRDLRPGPDGQIHGISAVFSEKMDRGFDLGRGKCKIAFAHANPIDRDGRGEMLMSTLHRPMPSVEVGADRSISLEDRSEPSQGSDVSLMIGVLLFDNSVDGIRQPNITRRR